MAAMRRWALGLFAGVAGEVPREEGQTITEYGLIVAGFAVVAMVGVSVLGPPLSTLFTTLAGNF